MLHGAMMILGEQETQADLLDAGLHLFRRQSQIDAGRLQHIGAAGFAGNRAVAVLGHAGAGGGADEGRRRADVEGVRPVAAGAAGVDQMVAVDPDPGHLLPQDLGGRHHFGHRLALGAQGDQKAADLRRRRLARHDPAHQLAHGIRRQILSFQQVIDGRSDVFHGQIGKGLGMRGLNAGRIRGRQ